MAKIVERDPAMGNALIERAGQLGLGRQWSPEWSAHSFDGGMVRELTDRVKARAVGMALANMLGRERGISPRARALERQKVVGCGHSRAVYSFGR